ncbi:multidrug ABC transporter ATP-binding protein [Alphaproteobacteria bacterium]|nr:multidrug ABC transporter ATP-binding protein [Alphaproteobacteria bacterium]GHS96822.1 multidrug ABC transporter ATP-binding protein [Alphaproteobacteria bacterium]
MIIVRNLSKSFGSKAILNNFSYQFPQNANISLIGSNGAGKTTLLNIISGLEEYDDGQIIIPKDCVLAYLPQSPCENPKESILQECVSGNQKVCALHAQREQALKNMTEAYSEETYDAYEKAEKEFADQGGYALEANAKGILAGLGFDNEQFEQRPQSLSGGWRMRLELAKLLLNDPNFLILDEPTNHLDLPSLTWLEQYLKSFRGTLLFVSHDRDFLNNLSEITLHMSKGLLRVYNGDFDSFLLQKEERAKQVQREKESLQKKQDHMQAFVDRFRAKASKAKQAQSRLKMIEKLKQLESGLEAEEATKSAQFKMIVEKPSGKVVFDIEDAAIGYEGKKLNQHLSLRIMRGDKIAVVGANGIGKSTLLKSIIGEVPWISGVCTIGANVTIGYYSQDQMDVLNKEKDVLENILLLAPHVTQAQARSLLGNLLITKDDIRKPVRVLSGGEKSKVALAALLAQKNNFLILDEPTNHLDMSSVETLAAALETYDGTVLVVSHNRAFINSFATHIFKMDKDKKAELIGTA